MKEILQLLICCWEIGMPIWYAGKCGEKRKLGWFGTGVWYVCVGAWLGLTYYQRSYFLYSRFYMIFEILVAVLLSAWRFRVKWGGTFLFISILYESIYMFDLLMLMLEGYWHGIEAMRKIQRGINYQGIAICIISRSLAVVCLYWLHKNQRVNLLYNKKRKVLYFIPAMQYLSLVIGGLFFYDNQKIIALRSVFILLYASMFIIVFFLIKSIRDRGEYERKIFEERAKAAELRCQDRLRDDRERDILVHDIQNHLVVLDGILRNYEIDRALNYIEEVREDFRYIKQNFKTGNVVVDIILASKTTTAEEAGIQVKILSDNLSDTFVADKDWCSILANLLDNATEACNGLEGERWIKLRLENRSFGILLNMENSCRKKEAEEKEAFKTTKTDKGKHGIGLQSANYATEKYGGTLAYKWEDRVFKVNVILYK